MDTKAAKYLLFGLLADLVLILGALLLLALMAAAQYDGFCGLGPVIGAARTPCSLGEYVCEMVSLIALLVALEWWWVLLPLLLAAPFAGFLLGLRRPAGVPPR